MEVGNEWAGCGWECFAGTMAVSGQQWKQREKPKGDAVLIKLLAGFQVTLELGEPCRVLQIGIGGTRVDHSLDTGCLRRESDLGQITLFS